MIKTSLIFVVAAFSGILFAKPQAGVTLPSGALKPTLPAIELDMAVNPSPYERLEKDLAADRLDGAQILNEMRQLETNLAPVDTAIETRTNDLINPKNKFGDDFFKMLDGNPWASPIFQYSAGDDSDDEQVYVWVNRDLRSSGPHQKKTADWLTKMRAGMIHLPSVEGVTFRGTRLLEAKLDAFFPLQGPMNDKALISTSIEPSTAFKFAHPGVNGPDDKQDAQKTAVVEIVVGKSGRAISAFAHIEQHEQEVLFANGTPMKVAKRSDAFVDSDLGKTVVILLTEE